MAPLAAWRLIVGCSVAAVLTTAGVTPALAHDVQDGVARIAVVSAFAPELAILRDDLSAPALHSLNGVEFVTGSLEEQDVVLFLSGISVVSAAMTVQLALDHFDIQGIVFSGIAGGVDPRLHIGDVVIADRWGQYLELVFAREVEGAWLTPPFFHYPYANFGMMFPRSVTVQHAGTAAPETRFWFPVDHALLDAARRAAASAVLDRCIAQDTCLQQDPRVVVGGSRSLGERVHRQRSVSASIRSPPSARACWTWRAPPWRTWLSPTGFRSWRSGASPTWRAAVRARTRWRSFLGLAAGNATAVVKELLRVLPD